MSTWRGLFGGRSRTAPPSPPPTDRRPRIEGIPVDRLPELIAEARRGRRRRLLPAGEELLARPTRPVEDLDDPSLRLLVDDLFATMAVCEGVGVAANQIGDERRVFVYDCVDARGVRHVGHLINPVLEPVGGPARVEVEEEGCLSVPGPVAEVSRAAAVVVQGLTLAGRTVEFEARGRLARCIQHECDHLDGTLYVDRLSARARRRALKRMAELQDATWAGWDDRAQMLGKSLAADREFPVVAGSPRAHGLGLRDAQGLAAPAA